MELKSRMIRSMEKVAVGQEKAIDQRKEMEKIEEKEKISRMRRSKSEEDPEKILKAQQKIYQQQAKLISEQQKAKAKDDEKRKENEKGKLMSRVEIYSQDFPEAVPDWVRKLTPRDTYEQWNSALTSIKSNLNKTGGYDRFKKGFKAAVAASEYAIMHLGYNPMQWDLNGFSTAISQNDLENETFQPALREVYIELSDWFSTNCYMRLAQNLFFAAEEYSRLKKDPAYAEFVKRARDEGVQKKSVKITDINSMIGENPHIKNPK